MGDSRLIPRAFAAMTGAASRFFGPIGESRPGLGLRRSARLRAAGYARMGRNVFERHLAAPSKASKVDY